MKNRQYVRMYMQNCIKKCTKHYVCTEYTKHYYVKTPSSEINFTEMYLQIITNPENINLENIRLLVNTKRILDNDSIELNTTCFF